MGIVAIDDISKIEENKMTPEQEKAAREVLGIIADTIKEAPDGCPLGPLYAALMSRGMTYETFNSIIRTFEQAGFIAVRHHCAFWIAGRLQ